MHKLQYVESLGRKIRTDDKIEELGESSFDVLRELIRGGRKDVALEFIDYLQNEFKWVHDLYNDWVYADLDYVAKTYGEEEIPKLLRHVREVLMKSSYRGQGEITVLDNLRLFAEALRAHRCGPRESGSLKIWEEKNRYVIELHPCGAGGRQRQVGQLDGIPPRTGEPFNLGVTQKPYPWSFGKKGVPYYCVHCCFWHEYMMIEKFGFPSKIVDYQDDPEAPCRWYFYKNPAEIPENYYKRLGMQKPE